ncbi:hypothetical protein BsIDN1_10550 [Bacillus safensis]|uniref:Uncharacterized protein n=1 Tax=Bacillus safensis TaxID=561879 RepID=A0A5S9M1G0_BACIA|nr:hypothetical protein BsIDN1_10550 [Bacillus safensis]
MIEEYVGSNLDAFTEQDYLKIGRIYTSLRDGMAKKEDYFNVKVSSATKSKAEEEFKKNRRKKKESNKKAGDPVNGDSGDQSR